MSTVCLSTALYEKTYQHYIDNDKLRGWLSKFNYKFDEIIIFFNNISEDGYNKCINYLKGFIDENITFYFSDHQIDDVISKFKLGQEYKSERGYYYSIANFSQILLSKSDYVMYICEDISIVHPSESFIPDSIEAIESNIDCIATSMNWSWPTLPKEMGSDHDAAEEEEYATNPPHRNEKFYLTNGFGDHIYFSKREKLLNIDYNTHDPFVNRFPSYSGNSFDKRLNSHQTINKMFRYVHKRLHYAHVGWWCYLKDLPSDCLPSKFKP